MNISSLTGLFGRPLCGFAAWVNTVIVMNTLIEGQVLAKAQRRKGRRGNFKFEMGNFRNPLAKAAKGISNLRWEMAKGNCRFEMGDCK